ncbi:phiSA1p31-related protein [Streptomyces sp. NPDC057927]
MAATFKVGDKVVNEIFGAGEIVYGPYGDDRTSYFMKADNGLHHTVTGSLLSPAAKFKVGDKAKGITSARAYTIEAGPFFSPAEWYAVKMADDHVIKVMASSLLPVEPTTAGSTSTDIKVGDVVRILRDRANSADVKAGDLLVVESFTDNGRDLYVRAQPGALSPQWYISREYAEKVDADEVAIHDGVVYDLTVRYRDRDDDYWTFKDVNGTARGHCSGANRDVSSYIGEYSDTLAEAVKEYGPLRKV